MDSDPYPLMGTMALHRYRVAVRPVAAHPHEGLKIEIDEYLRALTCIPCINLLNHFKVQVFDPIGIQVEKQSRAFADLQRSIKCFRTIGQWPL